MLVTVGIKGLKRPSCYYRQPLFWPQLAPAIIFLSVDLTTPSIQTTFLWGH